MYHARVPHFAPKPKFTENFLRGVQYLLAGAAEYNLEDELKGLGCGCPSPGSVPHLASISLRSAPCLRPTCTPPMPCRWVNVHEKQQEVAGFRLHDPLMSPPPPPDAAAASDMERSGEASMAELTTLEWAKHAAQTRHWTAAERRTKAAATQHEDVPTEADMAPPPPLTCNSLPLASLSLGLSLLGRANSTPPPAPW